MGVSVSKKSVATSFAQVPVDLAIKQTMNHDTKSKGGILEFNTNPRAVQQRVVTGSGSVELWRGAHNLSAEQVAVVTPQR